MTLIVSGMIGKYSILAADRKQSNLFTILINNSFLKDITKIRLVSGIAFSGTGRASILNAIKDDFTNLIKENPEKLLLDNKINYFNHISDFKGLNFVVTMQLNTGAFIHKFYLQGKNSYYNHVESSNNKSEINPYNIMVLQPADVNIDDALKYCIDVFKNSINDNKETIIQKLKIIFDTYSKESKFVSADFDVVFQSANEEPIILNVK